MFVKIRISRVIQQTRFLKTLLLHFTALKTKIKQFVNSNKKTYNKKLFPPETVVQASAVRNFSLSVRR